ncbi:MAG: SCP2 sterol-binding domain-containing protein [Spirochaetes bacterium]|nr:SCP2 sterol-binding domain-containing protein [Spirochaetota bacterium]
MGEYWGVKVEDIFNTMPDRFRPEGAKGVDASFGYDIKDEGKWKLTVKDGVMTVAKVDDLSGCVSIMLADGETFVGVNTGKVDGVNAFTSGKVKVEGDFGAFGKTAKMFKKFVIGKKEMSTRDYILDMFGTLESRFQPKNVPGLDASITYQIGGDGGGVWTAVIKDGKCALKEGHVEKPTVRLEVNEAKDWVDVMLGKTDPFSLLSAGRAAIVGETALAMKLGEIFAKYQPPASLGGEPEQELLVLKRTISVKQRFATGPVMGKFLNALKQKKLIGNKCPSCGRIQLPPREVCAVCRVSADEWVEVGPKGQVRYMEYVYYASPDPLTGETRETPYGMVNILLDGCEGNDTFAHLIRRDQMDLIKNGSNEVAGTRVRPVWNDKRVGSVFDIKHFEIDE